MLRVVWPERPLESGTVRKEIDAIKKHMQKEGIKFTMPNFFKAMIDSMRGLTDDQKMAKLTDLFGERAAPAVMDVVFDEKTLNKFYANVEKIKGTEYEYLDRLIKNIRKGGVGEYRTMMASFDAMTSAFGVGKMQGFAPLFDELRLLFDSMTDFFRDTDAMRSFGESLRWGFQGMIDFFKDTSNLNAMKDLLVLAGRTASVLLKVFSAMTAVVQMIPGVNLLRGYHSMKSYLKESEQQTNIDAVMQKYQRGTAEKIRNKKHEYLLKIQGAPEGSMLMRPENDEDGLNIVFETEYGF